MKEFEAWNGFNGSEWKNRIDVRDFIIKNIKPYSGDESFLENATEATKSLLEGVLKLSIEEREKGGVFDMDTKIISTITSHKATYLNKSLEKIVGFQTDIPFKRSMQPFGGIKMSKQATSSYGYELDESVYELFTKYRKTHNDGVFDAYTEEMIKIRKSGVITGLPDAYGRGRIIGDYRRVALYGVDILIEEKVDDLKNTSKTMCENTIRLREEISEQIKSLKELKQMANFYNFDISQPAKTAIEAVQWIYFAYLAAVKEQNGAAMSLGRVSTFLDIYFERDLDNKIINEKEAQEIFDHFVMKLRLVKFARTPQYNELFSGDPTWVTEAIGGISLNGIPMVTKSSYRMIHTLENLGPAPEPNLTVLWSEHLPGAFKKYCASMSIKTSAIQYENDNIMRTDFGDDYGIACCVSPMKLGKQVQFFGARANLAKALLYAINGGVDEQTGESVGPEFEKMRDEILDYEKVMKKFDIVMEWLAEIYVNTLNIIHYMHDKYCYERIEMALHDSDAERIFATGIAGLSVVCDSLSAIKYAKVYPIRNENEVAVDFKIEGDFPKYGNNDDRVDEIATKIITLFMKKLLKYKYYRAAKASQSILTITSNIVYGKKTGVTPDGRKSGEPFAPGANPMHGRDKKGALASISSVAKLPFEYAKDGISNTFSLVPIALGKDDNERSQNLSAILDGYVKKGGHHLNINVFDRDMLIDAMENPEKYPQLTIRVSGYAVNFINLNKEQQLDVIERTIHERI